MPDMLVFGSILCFPIFLFLIIIGNELFGIMVEEQLRYLRLIVFHAPTPAKVSVPTRPEPVARYVEWALGENRDPIGCVHIRHAGRIRYGKTGRWMNMGGTAFFSLAVPGFVWRSTITWVPGVWLEAFDYYIDRDAGMYLNLFSLFPLENAHTEEVKVGSLFRYLASTCLFPVIHGSTDFIRWENIDDSTAKATIRDKDQSVEALVRFNERGGIESIESCQKTHPETGRPVPGHFASRFSGYRDEGGYRIPIQIASDIILPEGEEVHAEYVITDIEFTTTDTMHRSGY
ncbi:MAG: DUF6544 family protein [Methanoregula sp.]|jgi:hypothetical protein